MKTWQPYKQKAGGGSDLRHMDDWDNGELTPEQIASARLAVADIVAREDTPYDVEDLREFLDMLGVLDD